MTTLKNLKAHATQIGTALNDLSAQITQATKRKQLASCKDAYDELNSVDSGLFKFITKHNDTTGEVKRFKLSIEKLKQEDNFDRKIEQFKRLATLLTPLVKQISKSWANEIESYQRDDKTLIDFLKNIKWPEEEIDKLKNCQAPSSTNLNEESHESLQAWRDGFNASVNNLGGSDNAEFATFIKSIAFKKATLHDLIQNPELLPKLEQLDPKVLKSIAIQFISER